MGVGEARRVKGGMGVREARGGGRIECLPRLWNPGMVTHPDTQLQRVKRWGPPCGLSTIVFLGTWLKAGKVPTAHSGLHSLGGFTSAISPSHLQGGHQYHDSRGLVGDRIDFSPGSYGSRDVSFTIRI